MVIKFADLYSQLLDWIYKCIEDMPIRFHPVLTDMKKEIEDFGSKIVPETYKSYCDTFEWMKKLHAMSEHIYDIMTVREYENDIYKVWRKFLRYMLNIRQKLIGYKLCPMNHLIDTIK